MDKILLEQRLNKIDRITSGPKFIRFLFNPLNYLYSIFYRKIFYKKNKKGLHVIANTFFDVKMHLELPSATDIFIVGAKSHDSEIRLAKFMINNLNNAESFVDVGAHYGYFTLLGSRLVGEKGRVISFEASPSTYKVLHKNSHMISNIKSYKLAVSDENSNLKFYEFPNLYSEYNTFEIGQFENQKWFKEYKPQEISIESVTLDKIIAELKLFPKLIKIDVEGAEFKVINGVKSFLSMYSPFVVMEFLSENRRNSQHHAACKILESLGYLPHLIDKSGGLKKLESISQYLIDSRLDSDNIVFIKA
ncbi:MAG TPA: FkbM family methyltransferase [Saprospiraceae bacterium]|nr:FkbM family methyltransferase [Saprospiraceae bacterium]